MNLKDWLPIIVLISGFLIQWGAMQAKSSSFDEKAKEISEVKADVRVIKESQLSLKEEVREMRHLLISTLRGNPRQSSEARLSPSRAQL